MTDIYECLKSIVHSFWFIRCLPPFLLGVQHGSHWNSAELYLMPCWMSWSYQDLPLRLLPIPDGTVIVTAMFFPTTRSEHQSSGHYSCESNPRSNVRDERMKQWMKQFNTWSVLRKRHPKTIIIVDCRKNKNLKHVSISKWPRKTKKLNGLQRRYRHAF